MNIVTHIIILSEINAVGRDCENDHFSPIASCILKRHREMERRCVRERVICVSAIVIKHTLTILRPSLAVGDGLAFTLIATDARCCGGEKERFVGASV